MSAKQRFIIGFGSLVLLGLSAPGAAADSFTCDGGQQLGPMTVEGCDSGDGAIHVVVTTWADSGRIDLQAQNTVDGSGALETGLGGLQVTIPAVDPDGSSTGSLAGQLFTLTPAGRGLYQLATP